jgi:hypothetical protein
MAGPSGLDLGQLDNLDPVNTLKCAGEQLLTTLLIGPLHPALPLLVPVGL